MAEAINTGGFWESALTFGEGALESIGERLGTITDAYVDYQTQKFAEKQGNPQVQKEAEPVKGSTVEGQPIVVTSAPGIAGLSTQQIVMVGGAVALVALTLFAARR